MYANGTGVAQDITEAGRWCRFAADQGLALAQYNLGAMHKDGTGVPQDYAEAAPWYRLAADQGHATAQCSLGVMYEYGMGVLQENCQDSYEAARLFNLACDQGFQPVRDFLGDFLGELTAHFPTGTRVQIGAYRRRPPQR